jgi:argonaute-like protein implicated in RNA metabolism and viral defense
MGVDLLYGQVIYVFVCGKGGRNVWVRRGMPRKRHLSTEKIDEFELADRFAEAVREAKQLGVDVNSVIIHRDGRWWSNEDEALTNAITDLQSDDTLPADCKVGVVEVHKSHLPARLFTVTKNANLPLENPIPGSFLKLNSAEILLTSTGQPGPWDRQSRTARTLLLKLVRGEEAGAIDIKNIAQDAYGLTHLNWNAPEIEISLPVTIRWSDERLREIVRNTGIDETMDTEEQEAAI